MLKRTRFSEGEDRKSPTVPPVLSTNVTKHRDYAAIFAVFYQSKLKDVTLKPSPKNKNKQSRNKCLQSIASFNEIPYNNVRIHELKHKIAHCLTVKELSKHDSDLNSNYHDDGNDAYRSPNVSEDEDEDEVEGKASNLGPKRQKKSK